MHSRIEDWVANLPQEGLQDMCTWEQCRHFTHEPESRKVRSDARVTFDGTVYEVEPDMAGETVILQWGLFDELLVVVSPLGDFEGLFCHVIPPQDRECGDLILITAKSSIYSRKPAYATNYEKQYLQYCFPLNPCRSMRQDND